MGKTLKTKKDFLDEERNVVFAAGDYLEREEKRANGLIEAGVCEEYKKEQETKPAQIKKEQKKGQ